MRTGCPFEVHPSNPKLDSKVPSIIGAIVLMKTWFSWRLTFPKTSSSPKQSV